MAATMISAVTKNNLFAIMDSSLLHGNYGYRFGRYFCRKPPALDFRGNGLGHDRVGRVEGVDAINLGGGQGLSNGRFSCDASQADLNFGGLFRIDIGDFQPQLGSGAFRCDSIHAGQGYISMRVGYLRRK